jgi:hypothetical protein
MLLILVICAVASPAFAWGTKGHRVIGALAQERLTEAARAAVADILEGEDLALATTWADDMRGAQDNPRFWSDYAANWHYVNIPQGEDYASSEKNPRGDAYAALETFATILSGKPAPAGPIREGLELYFGDLAARDAEVKRFALKFLLHIVGDLQQPLHSGYAGDRGGNDVQVTWFGEATNLHALWDTRLVEYQDLGYTAFARRLSARIARTPGSDVRFWETAVPLAWIEEAQRTVERIYARQATGTAFDFEYAAAFVPTVELQLIKGGLRTAFMLNTLFGGWPIGSWRDSPTAGTGLAGGQDRAAGLPPYFAYISKPY